MQDSAWLQAHAPQDHSTLLSQQHRCGGRVLFICLPSFWFANSHVRGISFRNLLAAKNKTPNTEWVKPPGNSRGRMAPEWINPGAWWHHQGREDITGDFLPSFCSAPLCVHLVPLAVTWWWPQFQASNLDLSHGGKCCIFSVSFCHGTDTFSRNLAVDFPSGVTGQNGCHLSMPKSNTGKAMEGTWLI